MKRIVAVALLSAAACKDTDGTQRMAQAFQGHAERPDEVPKVLNTELPFHYPVALYERRVQANVTLRLFIDTNGRTQADSTRIEATSGYPGLDSAALKGSRELRFVPAKLRGEPMATTVLFPVYFRHPEAHALPGDTILNKLSHAP
ncbi:MAG: TonB family protein [Gemmatimonadetes bacterium]|nr:TonB family protein [Gemmatimonadota bacterium]